MIYKIERVLLSSKVVGDDCWQEKNSKGFKTRLRNCPFNLLVIRGRIILKRGNNMIQARSNSDFDVKLQLSSFTATVIILNLEISFFKSNFNLCHFKVAFHLMDPVRNFSCEIWKTHYPMSQSLDDIHATSDLGHLCFWLLRHLSWPM